MDTARIELKPASLVRILSIEGDLRLTGADSPRLEAQAGRRGGLRVATKADGVELTCDGGCLVFLPADCRVEIGHIAGDGRVTDLTGALKVGEVEGDLRLRRLGPVTLGRVRGDLLAQRIRGELSADSAGGDARLEKLEGDLHLGTIAGDLRITALEGSLQAKVSGDASVSFAPRLGSRSALEADGDVKVRVPLGASLHAELRAEGDLRVEASGSRVPGDRSMTVTLKDGQAELTVAAGGDLAFEETAHADPSDLAGAITAQVEAALYEAEADLDTDLGDQGSLATAVTDQVRRALDRALRRDREEMAPATEAAADPERERQMILTMLAEHRITAEQAEALFRAMEGGG
jgi:hypothetical protein